ncbi:hypothetical protein A8950_2193 [Dongia mobilis]|uniref:Tetratricopeptide repeat protein n=1 Tax=Dongia mobilis TaxID=578943 RepID=A0A4R6WTZ8_9PROT|nr:hypothetical protein [Dongia mobilis]TDQ82370.1 hypothetical protein A8950_2193 [Dongia mobilis]
MGWRQAGLGVLLMLAPGINAGFAADSAALEQRAREQYMDGLYGAADESVRAAINAAHPEDFNRLILLQGLIASRLAADGANAADGRAILSMAVEHSRDGAWPRPVIDYLLGFKQLQQVANAIRGAGISNEGKLARLCELSFYAGAFAINDGDRGFAQRLLDKAEESCAADDPYRLLTVIERERLAMP